MKGQVLFWNSKDEANKKSLIYVAHNVDRRDKWVNIYLPSREARGEYCAEIKYFFFWDWRE